MKKAMTLTYEVGDNLYINITNRCPCNCIFCIRKNDDGAYGSDSLWLEHEPSMEELTQALAERDLNRYKEIVFCGYGEPLMRLTLCCDLAAHIRREYPDAVLRVNTNGLVQIYNPQESDADGTTAAMKTAAAFDKVSVSLNGGCEEVYNRVTNPSGDEKIKEEAFSTMAAFAVCCKAYGAQVTFTVVDVITPEEIEQARNVAENLGIPMEVRAYIH